MWAHNVCLKSASLGMPREGLALASASPSRSTGPSAGRPARPSGSLQRPERAGFVRIAVVVGHGGLALLFDEHPLAGERLHQPSDDLVQHRLQRFVGWRGCFDEDRFAFGVAPVHAAVQHQAVKVDVLPTGAPHGRSARVVRAVCAT